MSLPDTPPSSQQRRAGLREAWGRHRDGSSTCSTQTPDAGCKPSPACREKTEGRTEKTEPRERRVSCLLKGPEVWAGRWPLLSVEGLCNPHK